MREQYKKLMRQVELLDLVNAEGIKFKDMHADHLVSRLAIVEQRPKQVWEAVHKHYGDDFFYEMVVEEYGLSKEANAELKKEIDSEYMRFEVQVQIRFKQLRDQYEGELARVREELKAKDTIIHEFEGQMQIEIKKAENRLAEGLEVLHRERERINFVNYDFDKQMLYERI